MQARSTTVDEGFAQFGGDLDADGSHALGVVFVGAQPSDQSLRQIGAREFSESLDLPDIGHRLDAGDDRQVTPQCTDPVDKVDVGLGIEEELGDRKARSGLGLVGEDARVELRIPVADVGEGGHTDAEVAEGRHEANQVGRAVQPLSMRHPRSARSAGRIAAHGEDVPDARIGVRPHDPADVLTGLAHAGEMSHGAQSRLLRDLAGHVDGAVPGRAIGAIGHRDEVRGQPLELAD